MNLDTPLRDLARPDPVRLIESETVSEALARLRGERLGERILYFYVTREDGRLTGVVPVRRLLLSDPGARVGDVMVHPAFAVREDQTLGEALKILTARKLLALPVVDGQERLCGVLDVGTVTETLFDLERKESADEIFQIAGLHLEQARSRRTWLALQDRFPWLLLNILGGSLAALISHLFDGALRKVVAVAFFIPLVLTLSESVAMQTVTLGLDGLRLVRGPDRNRGLLSELRTGLLLGIASGAVVGVLSWLWLGMPALAMVVAAAIVASVTMGAAFGHVAPRLVHRLRLDPKIASGPAVLALTDIAALFCYLGLSALVYTR